MVTPLSTPQDPGGPLPPSTVPIHLLGYLAQLPLCRDNSDLLQTTLAQALRLTGAGEGVALAAGAASSEMVLEGAADSPLVAALERRLPTPTPEGEVTLSPAPDPALWIETSTQEDGTERTILYAALPAEGMLQGLLALVLPPGRALEGTVRDTLGLMATAAGGMLATRRLLSRTRQRLNELSLLYEVATVMGSTLELAALLKAIMRLTQTTLRSAACTLMLLDEDRQELVFEIPLGEKEDTLQQFRLPLDEGLAGWVARTGRPAIVNDLRSDPRFDARVDANSGFVTKAALCVPLQVRGRVIGVLEVLNKQDDLPYTTHDLALLTTLAGQASVAIDNARLYQSLQQEHERMLAAEEEVRRNLARDLHDGPAQDLAAMSMGLEVARRLLPIDISRARGEIESLEALAKRATRQVRTLQFELRPIVLETRGLRAALESYVQQLNQGSGTTYTLSAEGCKGRLPAYVEQAAFSIVQEALGNARKHAKATEVQVIMHEENRVWVIQVRDNGTGFDVNAVVRNYENRGSLGLLNMRERGAAIAGQLSLQSAPGQGTTVAFRIPAAPPDEPEPLAQPEASSTAAQL